ncbi:MAG: hypothetical protein AAGM22_05310 [Acidobacteriota bacterium]
MPEWYDGPRFGIADFRGAPHLYQSTWRDIDSDEEDVFLLSPVPEMALALALEDWAIWLRYRAAREAGVAPQDSHPALPEDRTRHYELQELMAQHGLEPREDRPDLTSSLLARAEFRAGAGGSTGLSVRWTPVERQEAPELGRWRL